MDKHTRGVHRQRAQLAESVTLPTDVFTGLLDVADDAASQHKGDPMKETKTETLAYDGIDKALAKLAKEGWHQVGRSFSDKGPLYCDVHLKRAEKPKAPAKPKAKAKAKPKKK